MISSSFSAGELSERMGSTLDRAAILLDRDMSGVDSGRVQWDDLWDVVTEEVRRGASGDRLAGLLDLLAEIRDVKAALVDARLRRSSPSLDGLSAALSSLMAADSVDALFTALPAATCRLGFDRALVSTVDGAWRLHEMCVVRDPRWAEEIVAVGRENPPILDRTIVENDTVTAARATLVHDVQDNPRVNRPLAEITRSTSYGIAPLLVDGEVVGLLHGDYYHQGRILRPEDQQLLSVFATGVSQTLARLSVLDGLAAVRAQFDSLIGRSVPRVGGHVELAPNRGVIAADASEDEVLTRREVQIMRMVAAGDSNGRISRRLVISESTVKSHMTHILRKLNAANRAEAVSLWLRSGGSATD